MLKPLKRSASGSGIHEAINKARIRCSHHFTGQDMVPWSRGSWMTDMIHILIGLNLALLGVVVSVPYPTNLIGNDPGSRVAVIIFISVFIVLSLLYLLMSVRAQAIKAWIKPVSVNHFYWMLASWGAGILVLLAALVLSFWYPLTGLIILAVSMFFGPLASRLTYME